MDVALKSAVKSSLMRSGRVWTGPAKGVHLQGPSSLRVYSGLYELELNRWFRRLVNPKTAVFDIGAQYGFDALMFTQLGAPRVLTVEADPEMEPLIRGNIKRNGMTDRISIDINWVGDGTNGVTLDDLAAKSFMPNFVKMDIEGAEAAALRGATNVLKKCGAWLIETHGLDVENECLSMLSGEGLLIDTVNQRTWLPDRRPMSHNRWLIARRPQ
jgi:hypothetical protein